jgi:hypothetical protein
VASSMVGTNRNRETYGHRKGGSCEALIRSLFIWAWTKFTKRDGEFGGGVGLVSRAGGFGLLELARAVVALSIIR